MSNLNAHLDNIVKDCAPAKDNNCLHREWHGLNNLEMSTVMAQYGELANSKHGTR